jgi:ubiquitin-conjugating enzyme E2 G1
MASPRNTSSSAASSSAALLLAKQFKAIQTDKDIPGISCGLVGSSVFEWEVMLMLSEDQDSLYGGK